METNELQGTPPQPAEGMDREGREKAAATRKRVREEIEKEGSSPSSARSGSSRGRSPKGKSSHPDFTDRTPEQIQRIRQTFEQGFNALDVLFDPIATVEQKDKATADYLRVSFFLVVEKWLPYLQYAEEINLGISGTLFVGWRSTKMAKKLLAGQHKQIGQLDQLIALGKSLQGGGAPIAPAAARSTVSPPPPNPPPDAPPKSPPAPPSSIPEE